MMSSLIALIALCAAVLSTISPAQAALATTAATSPTCKPVLCRMYCLNGWAKDSNGCDKCECAEIETPDHCCHGEDDSSVECMACSQKMSVAQYCDENPNYFGCQSSDITDKHGCCEDDTAECLACALKISVEQYCELKPTSLACLPNIPSYCCRADTAECLACVEKMEVGHYCDQHPDTVGCKAEVEVDEDSEEGGQEEEEVSSRCCKANTAECLACSVKMSEAQYCKEHPKTIGCRPQRCCRALTPECMACRAGKSVEEYCSSRRRSVVCRLKNVEQAVGTGGQVKRLELTSEFLQIPDLEKYLDKKSIASPHRRISRMQKLRGKISKQSG